MSTIHFVCPTNLVFAPCGNAFSLTTEQYSSLASDGWTSIYDFDSLSFKTTGAIPVPSYLFN